MGLCTSVPNVPENAAQEKLSPPVAHVVDTSLKKADVVEPHDSGAKETLAKPAFLSERALFFPTASLLREGSQGRYWRPIFSEEPGRAGRKDWLVQLSRVDSLAHVLKVHEDGTFDVEIATEEAPVVEYRCLPFLLRPWGESLEWEDWLQNGVRVYCAVLHGKSDEHSLVRKGQIVNFVLRNGKGFVDIQYDDMKDHVEFYVPVTKVGLEWPYYEKATTQQ